MKALLSKPVRLPLSFAALYGLLPAKAKKSIPEIECEPYELNTEGLETIRSGVGQKIYRFMLVHYDPDPLLIEVSRIYPRLYFVLGSVAPAVDEAASLLIRNGKARRYELPDKRRTQIRKGKYEGWGEGCLEADIDADWEMLDEVVGALEHGRSQTFQPVPHLDSHYLF